jgi:hypothetical protein
MSRLVRLRVARQEGGILSYDINFWKQERPLPLSPEEVYSRLNKREPVEGIAKLPVDEILARLKSAFPDFDPTVRFPDVRTSKGSIEFFWSEYHFRFDIRGICGDCQKLVDIMRDFDCPMYDPQANKRYDSQDGTALGEAPPFKDATPEQEAEIERIKSEFLAAMNDPSQKRGCAGTAALLVLALGGVAWAIALHLG